jgi:hypothetical protein
MHVTYSPEDGDRQEWTFKPGRVRSSEAATMEKAFGGTWDELTLGVQGGNTRARRVMLWHLLRREHARMLYEDTPDFYADELAVEFSVDELTPMRDRIQKSSMSEDQRDQLLAALDLAISEAMEREEGQQCLEALRDAGKALSETSLTDGGLSSPLS